MDPLKSIIYSKYIKFIDGTTTSKYTDNAENAPEWENDSIVTGTPSNATASNAFGTYEVSSAKLNWSEVLDDTGVTYSVEVFANGEKADAKEGLETTKAIIDRLSPGIEYTFKVFASDATGNCTEGPSTTIVTKDADEKPLATPSDAELTFSGTGYTRSLGTWESITQADKRVRGYKAYVNGELEETFYYYRLVEKNHKVSQNIGNMISGRENEVIVETFTDSGLTYRYNKALVKTTDAYDWKAPIWGKDSDLSIDAITASGDVTLSWTGAPDESGISGYRLYVDGKPMLGTDSKAFNHVNSAMTTTNTTYTVKTLDIKRSHIFKVEAADAWWKALDGSGPYHWTFRGPEYLYVSENAAADGNAQIAAIMDKLTGIENKSEAQQKRIMSEVLDTVLKANFDNPAEITATTLKNLAVIELKKETILSVTIPSQGISNNGILVLDISMKVDGRVTQPKTPVEVTMKIPAGLTNIDHLVAINYHGDEKIISPVTTNTDDSMSFAATKFSKFLIGQKTGDIKFPSGGSDDNNSNNDNGSDSGGTGCDTAVTQFFSGQWILDSGKWYFLGTQGDMAASDWVFYNNLWYYLDSHEKCWKINGCYTKTSGIILMPMEIWRKT